jgi:multisubunit Na+/H+ antiporter MnhF subunit
MIEFLLTTSRVLIASALAMTLIRLVRGPSGFDRLLAGETVALGLIGLLLVQSGGSEARLYIDAALGLALFSFVGVVVFAHFFKQGDYDD